MIGFQPDSHSMKLVGAGADIHVTNYEGMNLLHVALTDRFVGGIIKCGQVRYLVEVGIDPTEVDNVGNSLSHYLAKTEHLCPDEELLRTILDIGVPSSAGNHKGETALHIACLHPSLRGGPVSMFVQVRKMDINVTDHRGVRPIHIAASRDVMFATHLLHLGADPTVQTQEGKNPLMIACHARHCNLVGTLVDHHRKNGQLATIDEADTEGRSALHFAYVAGRSEAV